MEIYKCEDCEHYIPKKTAIYDSLLCPVCGDRLIKAHKSDYIDIDMNKDYQYCPNCDSYFNKHSHSQKVCPICDKFM